MKTTLDCSFSDALLLIGMHARTGELIIESGNNIGTMLFHQGKILQAFSPYSRAIGDLLVEDGSISDSELIETLKLQKRNEYTPLGGLLLKRGKVSIEVIEMMVHAQIRQAVKEFQAWSQVKLSFIAKEMRPYDRINLSVHEFIPGELLESARSFLGAPTVQGASTPVATSSQAAKP